jgi:hypothetical protein
VHAIEAIGAVVGSGIVDGLIEEVQQFDIGDALQLPNGGSPWSLDEIVSGDALKPMPRRRLPRCSHCWPLRWSPATRN